MEARSHHGLIRRYRSARPRSFSCHGRRLSFSGEPQSLQLFQSGSKCGGVLIWRPRFIRQKQSRAIGVETLGQVETTRIAAVHHGFSQCQIINLPFAGTGFFNGRGFFNSQWTAPGSAHFDFESLRHPTKSTSPRIAPRGRSAGGCKPNSSSKRRTICGSGFAAEAWITSGPGSLSDHVRFSMFLPACMIAHAQG